MAFKPAGVAAPWPDGGGGRWLVGTTPKTLPPLWKSSAKAACSGETVRRIMGFQGPVA